jgi:hypothetical protein
VGTSTLEVDVVVNVYDNQGINKIVAQDVYFEVGNVVKGASGAFSILELGPIAVQPRNALQACVQGYTGQILQVMAGLMYSQG